MPAQVTYRGGRCTIHQNIGQVGQASKQLVPVQYVAADCPGIGLEDL